MKSSQSVLLIIGLLCLHGCALTDQGERSVSCGPEALQCEYLGNPMGLDVTQPRLSWQLTPTTAKARGGRQTAYQILVSSSRNMLEQSQGDLWDSGQVLTSQSQQVIYEGQPLTSNMT